MILDGKRFDRIEKILSGMNRDAEDGESTYRDVAALLNTMRRLDEGGAALRANEGSIKILTRLMEGRMMSQGSRIDIPMSVKNFTRDPRAFMKHLISMNPAGLAAHSLSHTARLFSQDTFALGLLLLELLEEKAAAKRDRPPKIRGPKPIDEVPTGVKRKRGRPPKQGSAAGKADISALKPMHRPAPPPAFAHSAMRINMMSAQLPMLSGLTFCRVI